MFSAKNGLILPTFLLILGFCCLKIAAEEKVECYECVQGVDEGCADPFSNETQVPVDCSSEKARPYVAKNEHRDDLKYSMPIGCRKILQEIDDKTHVVRQCAYSGENVNGLKRVGNKGVRLFYYQCTGSKCNAAPATKVNPASVLLPLFLLFSMAAVASSSRVWA